jgi:hypothetical protein
MPCAVAPASELPSRRSAVEFDDVPIPYDVAFHPAQGNALALVGGLHDGDRFASDIAEINLSFGRAVRVPPGRKRLDT